ncbi:hypothetical protein [Mesorhizobium huakuii]|uniref:hypothetical protein n=1 Tax=Mesorhizobium huakuii TaxID=28104 RepID=UPI001FD3DCAC|nr:hypothetical protein [Mesorhizobium huakuii]
MDKTRANAREQFFAAICTPAASPDSIQTRVKSILQVPIEESRGDRELMIKFARMVDLLAIGTTLKRLR